ncbi:deoxyribose-phosphate aldolase [Marixanthomonas spongiae]|uniref:Deoxyribose-phosphate aldolase n=1 Tax=Marixanthomonas spongiae TaxID=2174845 RepID=A0A2U0I445_9FLAO|nr:deoxyribose-phosphate aldolase [Marixanthomonas spongiae]PVW15882.1 deoxyribose-phosphate aldolase [Marixanthomonas spongiae]
MKLSDYIDHTLLKPTATERDIKTLCDEAVQHHFKAVCVNGCYVKIAAAHLKHSKTMVAAVVGFPLGAMATVAKVAEAKNCLQDGANEIDMVLNVGLLKSGLNAAVEKDISEVKKAIGTHTLKVILETCYLTDEEITLASTLAVNAGADYVKTSTGFGTGNATLEAVKLMKKAVNGKAKIKASGGIRDQKTALEYLNLGVHRIGTSSGVAIVTKNPETNEHTY